MASLGKEGANSELSKSGTGGGYLPSASGFDAIFAEIDDANSLSAVSGSMPPLFNYQPEDAFSGWGLLPREYRAGSGTWESQTQPWDG